MKRIFLGGSRKVSRLNDTIRRRLEQLIERQVTIVIGDANGADRALQHQLAEWAYRNVEVFFVGALPRNNVGQWPVRRVTAPPRARGFEFYAAKDREMAREAEGGLMLWDGESRGTLENVENLLRDCKPVVLYVSPARRFLALANLEELARVRENLAQRTRTPNDESSQADLGIADKRRSTKARHRRRSA